MPSPRSINVDYWSLQYTAQEDDEQRYVDVLSDYIDPLERAHELWDWKDLSRGVDIETIVDAISSEELNELVERPPREAVKTLGNRLVERGVLSTRTVVTPAFLLHLTDSNPGSYSVRFPIFDVRCWVAYVYLTGQRCGQQKLPTSATSSPSRYHDFCTFFQQSVPKRELGRKYEQALFRFGAYITALPVDTISEIDEHLDALESSVVESYSDQGFALVNQQ